MSSISSAVDVIVGLLLLAAMVLSWILPLLIGLLIAFRIVRYREWLAILAFVGSMFALTMGGDFMYNLMNWSTSRGSPLSVTNVVFCILLFATPPFLVILTLKLTHRRLWWGVGMLVLIPLAVVSARNEFVARGERDAEEYRQALRPLTPETGVSFVRWWRDYPHSQFPKDRVLLQGHIPEKTRVVLLTDPHAGTFQPQFCTGTAATYLPLSKDPAEVSNVTIVAGLQGCQTEWISGVAALDRSVTNYTSVPFEPFSGTADKQVPSHPVIRQAFDKLHYDPANFKWLKTEIAQVMGARPVSLFVTALNPIRRPPDAYPCADPAVYLSIQEIGNIKTVLPYCALNWHLFRLDDEVYFAAVTQPPTPPGYEIMNPEQTKWLWRVEGTELKQLWP